MERSAGDKRARVASPVPTPETIENRSNRAAVVTAYCARPQCRKEFRRTMGRGRPRTYCSDSCRREADSDARRLTAQIQHHREMAEMLSRDLAAFDIDAEPAGGLSAPAPGSPDLSMAVARAEGVLIGLADGSPLANEFARLLDAVRGDASALGGEARAS